MSEDLIAELILGESAPIQRVRSLIARVGPTMLPVLIQGPTGSGKELVAQALHRVGRRAGAFVAFNVCAISESMFEDALFGHVRGAFSGAIGDAPGFLAEADGGSLFLDEIGGLPLVAQPKLLRAVETGEFRPVGARHGRRSDFRVIAAANEDLSALVAAGRFRADLLHRISAAVIRVPTLAERIDDIPILARHFARRATPADRAIELTDGALRYLQSRPWPGNVRELKHVVEYVIACATTSTIRREDIVAAGPMERAVSIETEDERSEFERRRLIAILEQHRWHISLTADDLTVHRGTLYRWMRRLGIQRPSSPVSRNVLRGEDADAVGRDRLSR